MKLSKYLKDNHISLTVFAAAIGRSISRVSRINRGLSHPNWETMERMIKETGGQVQPNDFSDPPKPGKGRKGTIHGRRRVR